MKSNGLARMTCIVIPLLFYVSINLSAGNDSGQASDNSRKAERIVDILDLNKGEAQAFLSVFNKAEEKQKALTKAERDAFFALKDAADKCSSDMESLLDSYVKAKKANTDQHIAAYKEYIKVLGTEKTAKLFSTLRAYPIMSRDTSSYLEMDDSESGSTVVPL